MDTRTVKLFKNGASQAVRLPAEFRFEGEEVYATRDEHTGDVILSKHPGARAWAPFFALLHETAATDEFMTERPMNTVPSKRGLFDDIA
jgi:antitoxin VapB